MPLHRLVHAQQGLLVVLRRSIESAIEGFVPHGNRGVEVRAALPRATQSFLELGPGEPQTETAVTGQRDRLRQRHASGWLLGACGRKRTVPDDAQGDNQGPDLEAVSHIHSHLHLPRLDDVVGPPMSNGSALTARCCSFCLG
jgi:hypothetical protein